jgi:hypothetical protein
MTYHHMMRFMLIAIALSATSCALIDAFGSAGDGEDGGLDPVTTDAINGECLAPSYAAPEFMSTVAAQPRNVAVGDFDGDSHLDIAVGESTGVEFFFGDSNGSFDRTAFVAVGVSESFDVEVADLNGGPDDLVVACDDVSNPSPIIFGLENPADLALGATGLGRAEAVAVLDLNKDSRDDVVTLVNYSGYSAMWGLNDGSGYLEPQGGITLEVLPSQVILGDFTGDSSVDLALLEAERIRLYAGSELGGFDFSHDVTYPANPARMVRFPDAVGDLFRLGVAFACDPCEGAHIFSVFDREGMASGALSYAGGGKIVPVALAVGKLDLDSQLDLVIANADGTGESPPELLVASCWNGDKFGRVLGLSGGGPPADVALGDFNDDGFGDIVVAIPSANQVSVVLSLAGAR